MAADDRIAIARLALERGDVFAAYDAAAGATAADLPERRYLEVLTLSRLGDWEAGLARYEALRLGELDDADCLALEGRLYKDRAYALPPHAQAEGFADAHRAYARAFERTGSSFAGINAATMAYFAGERSEAGTIARRLLAEAAAVTDYWSAATEAESLLLLDRADDAAAVIARAIGLPGANVGAKASTRRQLAALVARSGAPEAAAAAILDPLAPPRVAFFAGHMFLADAAREAELAARIDAAIAAERVGIAYGALACGADILFAEALLRRGAELHVVLPFDAADFLAQSVRPGGEGWVARFAACRDQATRVVQASHMNYVGDPSQFAFGSAVAMGMARLRADRLGAEAVQLSVAEETAANGVAGTRADLDKWALAGGRSVVIVPGAIDRRLQAAPAPLRDSTMRALRVMVFTDFKGFSSLAEPYIPIFWRMVMETAADAIRPYEARIVCRNTWGDALYLVFDEVAPAIRALLDLRDAMRRVDALAFGAAAGANMRIAAHYGSVYGGQDPVTGAANFYGSEVSRAARVEPVTPPGHVYVTEPLAAAASLTARDVGTTTYVGQLNLAKNYGTAALYRLDRA